MHTKRPDLHTFLEDYDYREKVRRLMKEHTHEYDKGAFGRKIQVSLQQKDE